MSSRKAVPDKAAKSPDGRSLASLVQKHHAVLYDLEQSSTFAALQITGATESEPGIWILTAVGTEPENLLVQTTDTGVTVESQTGEITGYAYIAKLITGDAQCIAIAHLYALVKGGVVPATVLKDLKPASPEEEQDLDCLRRFIAGGDSVDGVDGRQAEHEVTVIPHSTGLADEVELKLEETAREIHGLLGRTVLNFILTGGLLTTIKQLVKHGRFTTWVRDSLKLEMRSAQYYMSLYRFFASLGEDVISRLKTDASLITAKTGQALSEAKLPPEALMEIRESLLAGTPVTSEDALSLRDKYAPVEDTAPAPSFRDTCAKTITLDQFLGHLDRQDVRPPRRLISLRDEIEALGKAMASGDMKALERKLVGILLRLA